MRGDMIQWQDFDLTNELGPLLSLEGADAKDSSNDVAVKVFRRGLGRDGHAAGTIRKMGMGEPSQSIQETGQGKGPARMVGGSSSALTNGCSPIGMEAGSAGSVTVIESLLRKTGGEG